MKDYKRLTDEPSNDRCYYNQMDFIDVDEMYDRLADLEDKIERGELVDINELMAAKTTGELTDKEIEFFIKHNEKVRKETAREILDWIGKVWKSNNGVFQKYMFESMRKEYGVGDEE